MYPPSFADILLDYWLIGSRLGACRQSLTSTLTRRQPALSLRQLIELH